MRILYVTRQYPPHGVGGIGSYVDVLARLMARAGHQVTVLSAAPSHVRSTEHAGDVRVERFPAIGPAGLWRFLYGRSWVVASRLHAALSAFVALCRLGEAFDVIEAPEWKAEGLLLRFCRKAPVVIHLHLPQELVRRWDGQPLRRFRGAAIAEWLERRTVRAAAGLTAASQLSFALPGGERWLPGCAVEIVAPPMVVDDWARCPAVDDTDRVALFVGHLERRKAPEVLLDAVETLAQEIDGLRVLFVGRAFPGPDGTPYDTWLQSEAERRGIRCEVLAPRTGLSEMLDLYGRARVIAVPSRYETLSMVVLEGMACGRPVIMTRAVGASELVEAALPELVVPVDDPEAIAGAMRPLLVDAANARRVGDRARSVVREVCAPDAIVATRLRVYTTVSDR